MQNKDVDPHANTRIMYLQIQALFKWYCTFKNNAFLVILGSRETLMGLAQIRVVSWFIEDKC
jgi:hypothetical protein